MRVRMHTKAPLFLFVDAFNTRIHLSGGDKINSFISWIGGKKALRDEILLRFPVQYMCLIQRLYRFQSHRKTPQQIPE